MGTSVKRATAMTELYKKGESFAVPGVQVDGMDVLAVMQAAKEAVEYIRAGNGPMILEMKTYRFRGHSMSDPARYRSKEELADYKEQRDPLITLKQLMIGRKIADEDWFKAGEKTIKDKVSEAVEFASASPEPENDELYTDIYSDE